MRKYLIICFAITIIGNNTVKAQFDPGVQFPETGKAVPGFRLTNVKYFPKQDVSLRDFQGKWLILDFWSKYCSACMASMPEINEIQAEFKNQLQVMLICYIWREGGEEAIFDRLRLTEHLQLPVAFDSLLCQKYDIGGLPKYIIVDPEGIVRAMTYYIDRRDIVAFLKGQTPQLPSVYIGNNPPPKKYIDRRLPLLIGQNGGSDTSFVYRAVLTKWNNGAYFQASMETQLASIPNRIDITNFPLRYLYYYAFTGHDYGINYDNSDYRKFYPAPIIETKDSLLFKYPVSEKFTYSFSLTMPPLPDPKENVEQFKKAMQRNLKNYFGYNARLETRMVPCYRLTVNSEKTKSHLKTKGGPPSISTSNDLMTHTYINQPISQFVKTISKIHQSSGPIILDETNIKDNIDIKMENVLYNSHDWNNLILGLNKNGLDLLPGQIEMQILIIGDN